MTRDSTETLRQWFRTVVEELWPVAEGSLSLRRSPCIRPNCPACARGEGHSSYILYGHQGRRRLSIYVPRSLVPQVEIALKNGRRLQEVMNEAGKRYVGALKAERSRTTRREGRKARSKKRREV